MNIEDCFNKSTGCYVGLRYSCECDSPTTGVYFNDLEGMSLKRLSTVADQENHTGEILFKRLQDEAILEVSNDLLSELTTSFKFNHTIKKRRIGNTGSDFSNMNLMKGGLFERYNSDCFQSLFISKAIFKSDRSCKSKVYFETECGIEERDIDVKCGNNTIHLNYTTDEDQVCIYFDKNFEIAEGGHSKCGCIESCDKCSTICGVFHTRLFNIKFGEKELTGDNGICFEVSSKCHEKPIICEFANDKGLALAVRMKIGIKLMTEVLVSDGKHPLVRNGKRDAEILLSKWNGGENPDTGFKESSMYKKLLKPVVLKAKSFLENDSTSCVECDHEIGYFESI